MIVNYEFVSVELPMVQQVSEVEVYDDSSGCRKHENIYYNIFNSK